MSKYFNIDVIPDCIGGTIASNNGADVGAGDIIFNWKAVDVPKGSCILKNVSAYVNSEDGAYGSGSVTDYELVFAKSVNGVAPPALGVINAAQTACGELRHHFVGGIRLEGELSKGTLSKTAFGLLYNSGESGGAGTNIGPPIIIDLEPKSGTNVGYDKLYVAGFQISTRAYVADLDTPIPGTLTKVEELLLTFSEENSTVDIANDDELINANPIRIRLGFEK